MKKQALSLVEIVIAVAILVAALVPLWGLMGSSHQQVTRSADEIMASQLTVEILEQIEKNYDSKKLPEEKDLSSLESNGTITLEEGGYKINVGNFDDYKYMEPALEFSSTSVTSEVEENCGVGKTIVPGRIVSLKLKYKSKEGKDLEYVLRGYVGEK